MKDIVVHIREDVCAKHNRDPEATRLIEVAKEFGSVEPLEAALSAERTNSQNVVKNLTTQYETEIASLKAELERVKEQKVTPEELEVLRVIRRKTSLEASAYEEALRNRDEQLKAVQLENENRAAQIKALFNL